MIKAERYNYIIGDLQGCFESLKQLLKKIAFDPTQDFIWFAGDLVARGESSLKTLRLVKQLCEQGAAATVLGNHDLTLIACVLGFKKVNPKDKIDDILNAPDCNELIDWLCCQPLCLFPNQNTILTHAGVPCIWTAQQTQTYAEEVSQVLKSSKRDHFLKHMYDTAPTLWSEQLIGNKRYRTIVNYLTRMRLTSNLGELEFSFKDSLDEPMPNGFAPWFTFASPTAKTHQIFFGHWAALQGKTVSPKIQNVDGGCVWGGQLIAYCLEHQSCLNQTCVRPSIDVPI